MNQLFLLFYEYKLLVIISIKLLMFTGIVMEPGKQYSTVVENTFHLSMATLDLGTVKKGMYQHSKIFTFFVLTIKNVNADIYAIMKKGFYHRVLMC